MLATHAHAKTHRQVREKEVVIRVDAGNTDGRVPGAGSSELTSCQSSHKIIDPGDSPDSVRDDAWQARRASSGIIEWSADRRRSSFRSPL